MIGIDADSTTLGAMTAPAPRKLPGSLETNPALDLWIIPIMVSAAVGGFGPGFLATALGLGVPATRWLPNHSTATLDTFSTSRTIGNMNACSLPARSAVLVSSPLTSPKRRASACR